MEDHLLIRAARSLTTAVREGNCVVYFLRLRSGGIYIGVSTDLVQRMADHLSGRASRTTLLDAPLALLRMEIHPDLPSARRREAQLKRWSRAKKEAIVRGDLGRLQELSRSREGKSAI